MSDNAGDLAHGNDPDTIPPVSDGPQTKKRLSSKGVLIGLVVLTGALALLAGVQVWVRIVFFPGVATVEELAVPGQKVSPALTLIALAVLASALVLAIAGTAFRRVLGVLLGVLGAGLAVIGFTVWQTPLDGARGPVEVVTGLSGDAIYGLVDTVHATAWPAIMMTIGVVVVITGVCVIALSGRWKTGGRKYEASTPAPKRATTPDGESDRISDWEALSDGTDPTE